MAGDWIKMRVLLPRNPKVLAIATLLSGDRRLIDWWTEGTRISVKDSVTEVTRFGALVRVTCASLMNVWAVANDVAHDGFLSHASIIDLDDMGGVPGLGEAMAEVGWAIQSDDPPGVTLPNFREWNAPHGGNGAGKTNAQRCLEYRRRRREESTHAGRASTRVGDALEERRGEKRREEEGETPLTPHASTFADFWSSYPKKVGKAAALKAWKRLAPDARLVALILGALDRQRKWEQWTRDGGQFIPNPATWLNGRRWEDEAPPRPRAKETAAEFFARRRTEEKCQDSTRGPNGMPEPLG